MRVFDEKKLPRVLRAGRLALLCVPGFLLACSGADARCEDSQQDLTQAEQANRDCDGPLSKTEKVTMPPKNPPPTLGDHDNRWPQ